MVWKESNTEKKTHKTVWEVAPNLRKTPANVQAKAPKVRPECTAFLAHVPWTREDKRGM